MFPGRLSLEMFGTCVELDGTCAAACIERALLLAYLDRREEAAADLRTAYQCGSAASGSTPSARKMGQIARNQTDANASELRISPLALAQLRP